MAGHDVTAQVMEGYIADVAAKRPYYATSIHGDAWEIGRWLKLTGRVVPNEARKSRGDTYRVNDMLVGVKWSRGVVKIERIN